MIKKLCVLCGKKVQRIWISNLVFLLFGCFVYRFLHFHISPFLHIRPNLFIFVKNFKDDTEQSYTEQRLWN